MEFKKFKKAVEEQFEKMQKMGLYIVEIDKDQLWDKYLTSFREGANPRFRERTEHDCNCCKNFIRRVGAVVAITPDLKLISVWDVEVGGDYQVVADALSEFVKSCVIDNVFLTTEPAAGTDSNKEELENGKFIIWKHFFVQIPDNCKASKDEIGSMLNESRNSNQMMLRGLGEITIDAVETILELIDQNDLHRGPESRHMVEGFLKLKKQFDKLDNAEAKELFCWVQSRKVHESVARFHDKMIGTMAVDISKGKDLNDAVAAYEFKAFGYKRTTRLATKKQIEDAKKDIVARGYESALFRRYAVPTDISVVNVLHANRSAKKVMKDVFEELAARVPTKVKSLDRVTEMSIEDFINNVVRKGHAEEMEVLFENQHTNNLVSLIAPVDPEAKGMFTWNNNFSWSYNGDVAVSIKERVKSAGGNVEGDLCCRLGWHNDDDLDFHMIEPDGYEISYHNKGRRSPSAGILDIDANGLDGIRPNPCENIYYASKRTMKEGIYKLFVHQFTVRNTSDVGFVVEIDFMGTIYRFVYTQPMRQGEKVVVAEFRYSHANGIEFIKSMPNTEAVKEVWGVNTQNFHKVSMMMLSPNYWDGQSAGHKHYFFMLEGCRNEGRARGFYNEFFNEELYKHRRTMEMVGAQMKTDESDDQLSGLGFSSTQRGHLICKVKGASERTIKITF